MEATSLPLFCTQPAAELTLLAQPQGVYIAYERERDFMSAPKAYVVVRLPADVHITLNACHANEAQWQVLEQEPYGVYHYHYDDSPFFVFYGAQQMIDTQVEHLEPPQEFYRCADGYQAIAKAIG